LAGKWLLRHTLPPAALPSEEGADGAVGWYMISENGCDRMNVTAAGAERFVDLFMREVAKERCGFMVLFNNNA
jgi:hypothetical protein